MIQRSSSSANGARLSVRSWVALFLQERRRGRVAADSVPPPDYPVVTLSNGTYYPESGWFDVAFDIAVDLKTWPDATLEIWYTWAHEYELLDSVASSTAHYVHYQATYGELTISYKARYVNGGDVGPFSDVIAVDVQI